MSDKPDEAAPKKGKKGKILMLGIGLLVLVGGGVGGGLYAARSGMVGGAKPVPDNSPKLVLKSEQKQPTAKEGGEASAPGKPTGGLGGTGGEKYASTYYPMEKEFTANLQGSSHFIQVGLAVSTPYDERVVANLKADDIAVRSAVLMALGDTTEDQVFTSAGKQQLQRRIVKAINETLKQKEGFGGISNAYFTSFVVQ
ncbi:flagellar basal body-associated FliL family protein [Sphingomonas bacterium]|uniref:flagellar basal body-associated FliL family protein n=1 Tax=Sphingomonas bacterium TaxID=1895847 RepID=UPI0015766222|nr:flagellar basal body-associated FliL family protein [Sphingomonas bacterium]